MPRRAQRALAALALLGLLTGAAACTKKNPTPATTTNGSLQFAEFVAGDAIPGAYGRLVSVTANDTYPGWAQLWFERPDSSIVTVFVDFQNGAVRDKILEIPRS